MLWVAVALQMLRHCDEDARRQSHVEHPICFLAALLKLFQVTPEINERVILVVLARDVCAESTEVIQLLLQVLCGRLDVRLDPTQIFLVVHLRPSIANDLDIFGKEVVSVLFAD